jgi:HPt (histidine-containing phosphotransfer) domain-containing protein
LNEHQLKQHKISAPVSKKYIYNLTSLKKNNDEDGVIEILEMFITKTAGLIKEIKQAIEQEDYDIMVKKTAKLKGSLGSLQAHSMMKIVEEMELFIRMEDVHKIQMAVEKLQKEYDVVASLLSKELGKMKVRI